MATSFDINTYDLLQRSISTAEALNELGTEQRTAAFEAAETILDDREDSLQEQTYITESIAAHGPALDANITQDQFEDSQAGGTVSDTIDALLEAVLTAATYTDAFDPVMMNELPRPDPPQDEYDAAPEELLTVLQEDATAFLEDDSTSTETDQFREAAEHVLDEYEELESLPYTALGIVLHYLVHDRDIDPVVDLPEITPETTLQDLAVACLEDALTAYFQETLAVDSHV